MAHKSIQGIIIREIGSRGNFILSNLERNLFGEGP